MNSNEADGSAGGTNATAEAAAEIWTTTITRSGRAGTTVSVKVYTGQGTPTSQVEVRADSTTVASVGVVLTPTAAAAAAAAASRVTGAVSCSTMGTMLARVVRFMPTLSSRHVIVGTGGSARWYGWERHDHWVVARTTSDGLTRSYGRGAHSRTICDPQGV
jgi:hypothetical protein